MKLKKLANKVSFSFIFIVLYCMRVSKEFKERVLDILNKAENPDTISKLGMSEIILLYHWKRHKDDPMYKFVPKKYRRD